MLIPSTTHSPERIYHLLALCARAGCDSEHYSLIAEKAARIREWEGVAVAAEKHGLGPLLYTHLQAAGVELPVAVKRELQGVYLRHRCANRIRLRVLAKILAAYRSAGIQALVLKGAALSKLIYAEPGLRPMGDLDLLVPKCSDVQRAQIFLAKMGFRSAPQPLRRPLVPPRHMPLAFLHTEGLLISVEIHYNLIHGRLHPPIGMENLDRETLPFSLGPLTAYTLSYENMIQHLCQHTLDICHPFRLISMADVVSFAEYFTDEIDWERVDKQCPQVLNILSLFHFMAPLSKRLLDRAPIKLGRAPKGTGVEFRGWPSYPFRGQWCVLRDSFFPSEWWLRLYYDRGTDGWLFWHRWVRHPIHILRLIAEKLLQILDKHLQRFCFRFGPSKARDPGCG